MHDAIEELIEIGESDPDKLKNLRVFAIDADNTFRLINSRWHRTHHMDSYGYAAITKPDRGKILSVFAKLEFLVNECISLALFLKKPEVMPHIKYFKAKEKPDVEKIIQRTTPITCGELSLKIQEMAFKKRIEYSHTLGLINANEEKKMKDLADVRNFFAHEWDERLAVYNSEKLTDKATLSALSNDTISIFDVFIKEYTKLQEQIGYESLLNAYVKESASSDRK